MKVYHVEVNSNGWKYNSVAGDIDCATLDGMTAVEKFGDFGEWEMNISNISMMKLIIFVTTFRCWVKITETWLTKHMIWLLKKLTEQHIKLWKH